MKNSEISHDRRRELVAIPYVLLDGKPARISGCLNRFATVSQFDGGLSVEFSWLAVSRIVSSSNPIPCFSSN